jgi:isopentenyldiphosphate isomerase
LKRGTRETEFWYGYRYDLVKDAGLIAHPDEVAELRFVSLDELKQMLNDPSVVWAEDPKELIQKFILAHT